MDLTSFRSGGRQRNKGLNSSQFWASAPLHDSCYAYSCALHVVPFRVHQIAGGSWSVFWAVKAPIPLHAATPSLLSLSVSQSLIELMSAKPPHVPITLRGHTGQSVGKTAAVAFFLAPVETGGQTNVLSVSCWSVPRWLAWNRPSINICWWANKESHKPVMKEGNIVLWEHSSYCLWPGSMPFASGQRRTYVRHFELELRVLSFVNKPNLHVWVAPVMGLNMRSSLNRLKLFKWRGREGFQCWVFQVVICSTGRLWSVR